jgi:hypothetical protein
VIELADTFSMEASRRAEESFRGIRRNHDREAYRLGQVVTGGDFGWVERGSMRLEAR